ncbi:MAG: hypothetical protein Kow00108_07550 [Calditrichia bacterium]
MHDHSATQNLFHLLEFSFIETIKIVSLVFIMMVVIDLINIKLKGHLKKYLSGKKWRMYLLAGVFGVLPGCSGSYVTVSLYLHGTISVGAVVATMIATSGDESFVMLSMIPKTAVILFGILFIVGIISGFLTDIFLKRSNLCKDEECQLQEYHPLEEGWNHYITHHIYGHIIKKHLLRIFIWSFIAILLIHLLDNAFDFKALVSAYPLITLLAAAAIGLLPESGPHLIFVNMFAMGQIPFSILLTSSISQDGHGMLPLLSSHLRTSVIVKILNFLVAIIFGLCFYSLGF